MHILTFDIEDWHQLVHRRLSGELIKTSDYFPRQLDRILQCLADTNTKATFFILGLVVEDYPNIIKNIADLGHEIATHGYAHQLAYTLTRAEFTEDIKKSIDLIEQATGKKVKGYRAPEFSIRQDNIWVLDVLAEQGLTYDSSIFPLKFWRYGIGGTPRRPYEIETASGATLLELPLSTITYFKENFPVAGGGFFRLLPEKVLRYAIRRLEREDLPMLIYLHPYELAEHPLNIFDVGGQYDLRHRLKANLMNFKFNLGREQGYHKLKRLLQSYRFVSCEDYIDHEYRRESTEVFQRYSFGF